MKIDSTDRRQCDGARRPEARRDQMPGEDGDLLESVLMLSPVIFFRADLSDACVKYVTPNVTRILGYAPEEVLQVPSMWSACIHRDDRERFQAAIERAL